MVWQKVLVSSYLSITTPIRNYSWPVSRTSPSHHPNSSAETNIPLAYGYSCTAVAPLDSKLQSLAQGAVAAIKAIYGTIYQAGPICTTIYQATGTSVDYVNDISGAKYTFTSELRDTGTYGFVLPASQILPTGIEAFAGFKYLLQNLWAI